MTVSLDVVQSRRLRRVRIANRPRAVGLAVPRVRIADAVRTVGISPAARIGCRVRRVGIHTVVSDVNLAECVQRITQNGKPETEIAYIDVPSSAARRPETHRYRPCFGGAGAKELPIPLSAAASHSECAGKARTSTASNDATLSTIFKVCFRPEAAFGLLCPRTADSRISEVTKSSTRCRQQTLSCRLPGLTA